MNIQEILAEQSIWTWNILRDSAQLGEVIREDAVTSVNLSTIERLARQNQIDLSITSMQGSRIEMEYGADWLWTLNQSGKTRFLVQAKRLDFVRPAGAAYSIDIPQLQLLIDASETLSSQENILVRPVYVFYNTLLSGQEPFRAGCIFLDALTLLAYVDGTKKLGQQSTTLSFPLVHDELGARPWFEMFN